MTAVSVPTFAKVSLALLLASSLASTPVLSQMVRPRANADENSLHYINNPGGGQVVYGTITDQNALPGAMLEMLHVVHTRYGEKEQISDFFRAKNSKSVATFFSTHGTTQGGGKTQLTGLVIVTMDLGASPVGAVLVDSASHFAESQPQMMTALNREWGMSGGQPGNSRSEDPRSEPNRSRPTQTSMTLRQVTAGDHSASIMLPTNGGWHLSSVKGGSLIADGPDGEMFLLGLIYGQLRLNPNDLFGDFVQVTNQDRQQHGAGPGTFHLTSQSPMQSAGGGREIAAYFTVDFHDGFGPRKAAGRIGMVTAPNRMTSNWALGTTWSCAPAATYNDPLMNKILQSYSQDASVINREYKGFYDNLAATQRRVDQQVHDSNERRENSVKANEQHMTAIDVQSKVMQNYILDRSQIAAVGGNGATATVSNSTGAALVAAYPNSFQIVPPSTMGNGTLNF